MKPIILRTILLISLAAGGLFFGGCKGEDEASKSFPVTGLIIHNRSQFELEHLFVYPVTNTYQQGDNLLESNLQVGELVFHRLEEGEYLVTVSRRQNATGDLLAYTTTEAIVLDRPKVVEYYDTEFRIYDLKLTVPTESSLTENNETDLVIQRAGVPQLEGSLSFIESPME